MGGFTDEAISLRIHSIAANAVKALRQAYGRDEGGFIDADSLAIKNIEDILKLVVPATSEYQHLEAIDMTPKEQPKPDATLNNIREMLVNNLDSELRDEKPAKPVQLPRSKE